LRAPFGSCKTESASRSGDARNALESIGSALLFLAGDGASAATDNSGSSLLEDLTHRVSDLQSASASGADAAARVGALAESLRTSLHDARDHFKIGRLFADTADRCCNLLGAVAAQAPPSQLSDPSALERTAEDLYTEDLYTEDLYTMEAERKVHRALSGDMPLPAFEAGRAAADGECGEEVEFF
jgi:hypothetical protein